LSANTAIPRKPRSLGRALAEMHYQLQTEGDTPMRTAASVFLGTVVGCIPLYGAHFVLCMLLARALRLSRMKAYLAAHINNPVTFPLLVYLEFGIGSLLAGGRWPALTMSELRSIGLAALGLNLLIGSAVLGLVLGTLLAVPAYFIKRRARSCSLYYTLGVETSRRYQDAGVLHWEFVRGKLKFDPVYRAILASGLLPPGGKLVDLGCGRGILLSLVQTARSVQAAGKWTDALPPPPPDLELRGVELREPLARVARLANGEAVPIETADLASHDPAPADVYLLLDVLHYLSAPEQERLLDRIARRLPRGGLLVLREPDAGLGLRFVWTRLAERLCALFRLHGRQRFHYRTAQTWCDLLEGLGLTTRSSPLWSGTPYGNVLIEARKP